MSTEKVRLLDECYCGDARETHSDREPYPCKEIGCDCPYFDLYAAAPEGETEDRNDG